MQWKSPCSSYGLMGYPWVKRYSHWNYERYSYCRKNLIHKAVCFILKQFVNEYYYYYIYRPSLGLMFNYSFPASFACSISTGAKNACVHRLIFCCCRWFVQNIYEKSIANIETLATYTVRYFKIRRFCLEKYSNNDGSKRFCKS